MTFPLYADFNKRHCSVLCFINIKWRLEQDDVTESANTRLTNCFVFFRWAGNHSWLLMAFITLNIAHSQQMMEWNWNLLILCEKLDYRRCQTSFTCYHSYRRLSSYPFVALLVPPALLLRTIKGCGPPLNGIHLLVF